MPGLPTVDEIAAVAASGVPYLAVIGLSLILHAAATAGWPGPGLGAKSAPPILPYELCAQATRAAAAAVLGAAAARTRGTEGGGRAGALAVAYAFALGILRLIGPPRWRPFFRTQRNLVAGAALVILLTAHIFPCIEIQAGEAAASAACSPVGSPVVIAILLLALSCLAGLVTPRSREGAPEERASLWARWLTYSWIDGLMWRGLRGGAHTVEDLPRLPAEDEPAAMLAAFRAAYARAAGSLSWTLAYFGMRQLLASGLCAALAYVLDALVPVGLYGLLRDLDNPAAATVHPWAWLALTFAANLGYSAALSASMFQGQRFGVRVKAAFTMALHDRAMNCDELGNEAAAAAEGEAAATSAAAATTRTGRLCNLMATDVDNLWRLRTTIELLVGILPGTVLHTGLLVYLMGWAAVPGAVIVVLQIPIAAMTAQGIRRRQGAVRAAQDRRISAITEFFACIRPVKYFGWESMVADRISAERATEQRAGWRVISLRRALAVSGDALPCIAVLVMFALDGLVMGRALTADRAYTTIYLVKRLRQYYGKVPNLAMQLMGVRVAVERLSQYFGPETTVPRAGPDSEDEGAAPRLRDVSFRLGGGDGGDKGARLGFRLDHISIEFVEGGLNVVTGPSGSGKTALLLSILGETRRVGDGGHLGRPRDVAFAPQTPWVPRRRIRDGILFFSPMEEARYAAVLRACCLGPDLAALPAGDLTAVAEGGSGLSGGQRARVALARALYSRAPLLLLDDVFAALDARTAAAVWRRCFCGGEEGSLLLRGRTVVLVSQVPWMSDQADLAVRIEAGRVVATERNLDAAPRKPVVAPPPTDDDGDDDDGDGDGDDDYDNDNGSGHGGSDRNHNLDHDHGHDHDHDHDDGRELPDPADDDESRPFLDYDHYSSTRAAIRDETEAAAAAETARHDGRLAPLIRYISHWGGPLAAATFAALGAELLLWIAQPIWVTHWVSRPEAERLGRVGYYLSVYALVSLADSAVRMLYYYLLDFACWRAGGRLHAALLRAVLAAPLSWWTRVPVGRVVNRFSRDIYGLDWDMRPVVNAVASESGILVLRLGAAVWALPALAGPALALCVPAGLLTEVYARNVASLRQIEAAALSPVFSIFADSAAGLEVIRAHGHGARATADALADALSVYSSALATNWVANRWLQFRVATLAALVVLAAGAAGVVAASSARARGDTAAVGRIGLGLSSAGGLAGTVLEVVVQIAMLELQMQKLHRVEEHASLRPEEEPDEYSPQRLQLSPLSHLHPPPSWPDSGAVELRGVTVRYDPDGPDVLRNVSLRFEPGERVAIVGRTGSGKSTLALTLLRFTHVTAGQVLYDGVDIGSVPRRRLREAVTLIPQEPVLLAGTVGFNLNPTGTVPAEALAAAAASCAAELKIGDGTEGTAWVAAAPDGHVAVGGGNLSHGQRQVLALCRALARQSRLVVLDEATASMDYETDSAIQRVLRREMWADRGRNRTLVTIAHRLRTIVDYDKVVVLGKGEVMEVGSPRELYGRRGTFYDMVHHSGEAASLEKLFGGAASGWMD